MRTPDHMGARVLTEELHEVDVVEERLLVRIDVLRWPDADPRSEAAVSCGLSEPELARLDGAEGAHQPGIGVAAVERHFLELDAVAIAPRVTALCAAANRITQPLFVNARRAVQVLRTQTHGTDDPRSNARVAIASACRRMRQL